MSAKRSAMRKIKEVLRLKFEAKLSHEKIAAATGMSKGAVTTPNRPPHSDVSIRHRPWHLLGLGLSLSRSILTAHGGHLRVENHASNGATFHCTIPEWRDGGADAQSTSEFE